MNVGRLRITSNHIALIRHVSRDNPSWGDDELAQELVHFGCGRQPAAGKGPSEYAIDG